MSNPPNRRKHQTAFGRVFRLGDALRSAAFLDNLSFRAKQLVFAGVAAISVMTVLVFDLVEMRQQSEQDRKELARDRVYLAYDLLIHYHAEEAAGRLTTSQAREMALSVLNDIRMSDREYYWLTDDRSQMIMHPYEPRLLGTDVSDLRDGRGWPLIAEFEAIIAEHGEGYASYLWPRPGSTEPVRKIAFVKGFRPWGWIVGSAIFVDDVKAVFWSRAIPHVSVAGLLLALAFALAIVVGRSVTRPLAFISRDMLRLSEGNLNSEARYIERGDELGDLARAMEVFKRNHREIEGLRSEREEARERERAIVREREEYFRALFEGGAVGTAVIDLDGRCSMVNDAFCEMLGRSREEIVGAVYKDFIHPDDRAACETTLEEFRAGDVARRYGEKRYLRKDGRTIWALVGAVLIRNADGTPRHSIRQVQDLSHRKIAEETLRDHEARMRSLLESAGEGIYGFDLDGTCIFSNPACARILGYSDPEELRGSNVHETIHGCEATERGVRCSDCRICNVSRYGGSVHEFKRVFRHRDGGEIPVEYHAQPLLSDGEVVGAVVCFTDISERLRTEATQRKLSQVVEQSPSIVVITDAEGRIEYVNPSFERVTGYRRDEVIGRNPRILKSGLIPTDIYRELWGKIVSGCEWRGEFYNRKKNGDFFWEYAHISPLKEPNGKITHFVAVKEDITARKQYEERLIHQANHDDLTGLPNRVLAADRLDGSIKRARRDDAMVAVILVTLDNFGEINGALGHAAGDRLMLSAAERLRSQVNDDATVARVGGDEFLVILPDLKNSVRSELLAREFRDVLSQPFHIDDHEVMVRTNIGITIAPNDGDDPDLLLRNAHAAAARAGEAGPNAYRFFTPKLNKQAAARMEMIPLLSHALENNEFHLVYQPLVRAQNQEWVGAEALLRWRNPRLGTVAPDRFIPLAEESDLIVSIGAWVLREACMAARSWYRLTGHPKKVAVNVSARQLEPVDFLSEVSDALNASGLPAELLEIELTERVLVEPTPASTVIINELSEMGVKLAVDDFGTGYSALSYLRQYPFRALKIDSSFVSGIPHEAKDAALVKAVISMARDLGLSVVGEGVETEEQAEFLRENGCDLLQGYLFGQPFSGDRFEHLLARGHAGGRKPIGGREVRQNKEAAELSDAADAIRRSIDDELKEATSSLATSPIPETD